MVRLVSSSDEKLDELGDDRTRFLTLMGMRQKLLKEDRDSLIVNPCCLKTLVEISSILEIFPEGEINGAVKFWQLGSKERLHVLASATGLLREKRLADEAV